VEDGQGGEGFAVDVLGLEERNHLLGQPADFRPPSLPQIEDRQIERHDGGHPTPDRERGVPP